MAPPLLRTSRHPGTAALVWIWWGRLVLPLPDLPICSWPSVSKARARCLAGRCLPRPAALPLVVAQNDAVGDMSDHHAASAACRTYS
jgi:hypothetical protein